MNAQTATTGFSRMDQHKRTAKRTMTAARAFLAKVEADERLAEKMAEADGDMPRILALAAEAGHACTERELVAAYDEHVRSESAKSSDPSPAQGPRAPSDPGYPEIYLSLRAPSEVGHPIVYLSARA